MTLNTTTDTGANFSFDVQLISCEGESLQIDVADSVFTATTATHYINAPTTIVTWLDSDITESVSPAGICGGYDFAFESLAGGPPDPALFDVATPYQFKVSTNDLTAIGTHNFIVKVKYTAYSTWF